MSTLDRKAHSARATKKLTSAVKERARVSRRLFENQLVQVSLRLPRTTTEVVEVEFEMPVHEFMANVLATSGLSATTDDRPEDLDPTPRLRRAMASAEKIKRGRFATVDDLFDALDKAAQS